MTCCGIEKSLELGGLDSGSDSGRHGQGLKLSNDLQNNDFVLLATSVITSKCTV